MSLFQKEPHILRAYHIIDQANEMRRVENLKKKSNLKESINKRIGEAGFLIDYLYKSKKSKLYHFS